MIKFNMLPGVMRWFGFYFGHNWYAPTGHQLLVHFLRRPDLMTRNEEGDLVLVGFEMRLTTAPLRVEFRSDAGEIARRLADGVPA